MVSDHCEYCGHRSAHYPSCGGEITGPKWMCSIVSDHWLARIELAEARANAAEAERDRYREALEQVASENGCFSINAARVIARAALDG